MKWFKHDSNAHNDAKLEKVKIKYGMEGYGLYWYCLELIVNEVSDTNLTFELEHDAEIIAHRTGIHFERVQEMMTYMCDLGLFENQGGTITCMKILKRLDKSMTSSKSFREMIDQAKTNHGSVMTIPDKVMQDKTRLDKTRLDNRGARKRAPQDFEVTIQMLEWADSELGMSAEQVKAQTAAFMDHEFKTAKKDWHAVWRNWLRRSKSWERSERSESDPDPYFDQLKRGISADL